MTLKRSPARGTAGDRIEPTTLDALNAIIAASKPLVPGATRAVLGEGPIGASMAFVGEQPGDQEDRQGRPFVGPAGQLLDRAMSDAGINRHSVYVTNAIKHFKFEQRGKRRIHERPNREEILACRMWLEAELAAVKPRVLVALGATAASTLLGSAVRVTKDRGRPMASTLAETVIVTVHPSSILRAPDEAARHEAMELFVRDLKTIARARADAVSQPSA